jgi:hypothetical protein
MTLIGDALVAAAGFFVATKAMEPVTTVLYEHESEADRERERRVSPGLPYRAVHRRRRDGRVGGGIRTAYELTVSPKAPHMTSDRLADQVSPGQATAPAPAAASGPSAGASSG